MSRPIRLALLVVAAVFVVGIVAISFRNPTAPARCREEAPADAPNVVRQLRSVQEAYELELTSEEPFVVRAMPTLLRIGSVDMGLSRIGLDGHTIVFTISSENYAQLETGDPILVHHTFIPEALVDDPDLAGRLIFTDGGQVWTFGRFDKSQLDCPPLERNGELEGEI